MTAGESSRRSPDAVSDDGQDARSWRPEASRRALRPHCRAANMGLTLHPHVHVIAPGSETGEMQTPVLVAKNGVAHRRSVLSDTATWMKLILARLTG